MDPLKQKSDEQSLDGNSQSVLVNAADFGSGWSKFLNWLKTHKLVSLLILLCIIAVIFVAGYGLYLFYGSSPAIKVGDQKISRRYYDELVKQASSAGINKDEATNIIIDSYKAKQAAAQVNIKPLEEDVKDITSEQFNLGYQTPANDWQKLSVYQNAVKNQLAIAENGGYQGAVLYFPFNTLFVTSGDPNFPEPEGFGNPSSIQELKQYASTQANNVRQDLVNKKISVGEAIAKISNDPKLEFAGSANSSYQFTVDNNGNLYSGNDSLSSQLPQYLIDSVVSTPAGQISDIKNYVAEYNSIMLAPGVTSPTQIAYYFVDIQKKISPNKDIQSSYDNAYKNIKVVNNVNKK